VAAITGAASGIGRALALRLAGEGCALSLCDVDEAGLAATAGLAKAVKVTTARVDVSVREAVFAWAADTVRDHGAVNLIFNNAGVALAATAEGITPEEFQWLMGINFWGVIHGTQAFLPHLRASGDGHVINISSLFGLIGFPGHGAYNASKFAVRGYTECLRQELVLVGAPVGVTCVHPGGIKTNIARASRVSPSVRALGIDPDASRDRFDKSFRTSADEAARVILAGVRRNEARVLIGSDARLLDLVQRVLGAGYMRLSLSAAKRMLLR
jgi:NAD(P)-dependent dehydrogenase (short-subunit alcohol dehydrogenase family)